MSDKTLKYPNILQALDLDFFNSQMEKFKKPGITMSSARYYEDNSIELNITSGNEPETSIVVRPLYETDNYRLCTDKLAFFFRGDTSPVPLPYENFLKYMQKRLDGVSFDRFMRQCRKDGIEYSGRHSGIDDEDSERAFYGWKEQWRTFFSRSAIERNSFSTFSISNPKRVLNILDRECSYSYLPMSPNLVHYHNFPGTGRTTAYQNNCKKHLVVDVTENDLIMGTRAKVKDALEKLAANAADSDLVYINSTCASHITGEDYEDIGRRVQEKCGIPVFYEGPKRNEEASVHSKRMKKLVRDAEKSGTRSEKTTPTLNLIGFPISGSFSEIIGMLRALGIDISATLYPGVDFHELEKAVEADLNVIYPCEFFEDLSADLFDGIDIPVISPPAPYGIKSTHQWIYSVAVFFGKAEILQSVWEDVFGSVSQKWEDLQGRAAEHRLAFVADAGEMNLLLKPESFLGIRMLDAINEMGFGIDILFYVDGEFNNKQLIRQVEETAGLSEERIKFSSFRDSDELRRLIVTGDFDAVYSDFVFDHRITSAGKSQFSMKDFEPGVRGALLTIERFLRICDLPFYRRFSRHLPERKF